MSGGVKIVIINTEYVETDATSFKSVVQRLTGKDSTVGLGRGVEPTSRGLVTGGRAVVEASEVVERSGGGGGGSGSIMSKVMSFKDLIECSW
ncbi:hypothetical protein ACSBR2_027941 [Camellia fascicularis]